MNEDNEPILIGQVDDIELDSVEAFEYDEIDYAIYHLSSGFYATQELCPCDQNGLFSEGIVENEEVECPSCGKTFSIVSGDPISNPEANPLKVFEVTIEGKNLFLNLQF